MICCVWLVRWYRLIAHHATVGVILAVTAVYATLDFIEMGWFVRLVVWNVKLVIYLLQLAWAVMACMERCWVEVLVCVRLGNIRMQAMFVLVVILSVLVVTVHPRQTAWVATPPLSELTTPHQKPAPVLVAITAVVPYFALSVHHLAWLAMEVPSSIALLA